MRTSSRDEQPPFQFTHPGRGATSLSYSVSYQLTFQFTHPGRGATCQIG